MQILNLTNHPIIILDENTYEEIATIPQHGSIELQVVTEEVGNIDGVSIRERKIKGFKINIKDEYKDLLEKAKAIVVAAQIVDLAKKIGMFKGKQILTVGETLRDRKEDGITVIKGAFYLVKN